MTHKNINLRSILHLTFLGKISMINAVSYCGSATNSKADLEATERHMQFVVGPFFNIVSGK